MSVVLTDLWELGARFACQMAMKGGLTSSQERPKELLQTFYPLAFVGDKACLGLLGRG
jgi:hypothetical protein